MDIGFLAARFPLAQFSGHSAPTGPQLCGLVLVVLAVVAFVEAWHLMSRKWRAEPR